MSLDWSVKEVKYFQDNPDELWVTFYKGTKEEYTDVNVVTKSIIFSTMMLGIGTINWQNCPDFYARWKVYEKYDGLYLYEKYNEGKKEKHYLKPTDVVRHMNLTTNVGNTPENEWCKKVSENLKDRPSDFTIQASASEIKNYLNQMKREFVENISVQ